MDPYLEHPALWPDVHNSLIAAIRDAVSLALRPKYYAAIERRTYRFKHEDLVFIGVSDLSVIPRAKARAAKAQPQEQVGVLEVEVPMRDEVEETFLEVRDVASEKVVTILEILSPANKIHPRGREEYETKREEIFSTSTNLIEADLLRAGEPMPVLTRKTIQGGYRILLSRGSRRPSAQLFTFGLRQSIPRFPLPLLPGDSEPEVNLSAILHSLYERASFDLRLDYTKPAVPPLSVEDAEWASGLVREAQGR